jgi:hypothetical protein
MQRDPRLVLAPLAPPCRTSNPAISESTLNSVSPSNKTATAGKILPENNLGSGGVRIAVDCLAVASSRRTRACTSSRPRRPGYIYACFPHREAD